MITLLEPVIGEVLAARMRRLRALQIAYAISQGIAYLTIFPALIAVFQGDFAGAWRGVIWIAAAVVVAWVLNYVQTLVAAQLQYDLINHVQAELGDHLARLPLGWFPTRSPATVGRTVATGSTEIGLYVSMLAETAVSGTVVPVTVSVGMLVVDWRVALVMMASVPVLYAVHKVAVHRYRRAEDLSHRAATEANAQIIEYAQAQAVLRAFGAAYSVRNRLNAALIAQREAAKALVPTMVPGQLPLALATQAVFLVLCVVLIALCLGGGMLVPVALAVIAVAARCVDTLLVAANVGKAMRDIRQRTTDLVELATTAGLSEPGAGTVPGAPTVEFRDVSFGYPSSGPVIRGANLTAPAGSTTAIVGPSGAGKTTLLRLAARFYEPESGEVLIGGHRADAYRAETLYSQISVVFQDVYLFDTTIAENIRLGRPDATEAEVMAAAAQAGVTEIIERLPDGWDSRVGEGGATLSGGERQRVSIARALLKDAPIVLLDEATSALDPENEAAVLTGLGNLTSGRTVVVVAHRLSTIQNAHHIVFVDQGRVIEEGTHVQLLERGHRYAAFWNERRRAAGWHLGDKREL